MAAIRAELKKIPDDRLHIAAAKKDGFAEVKRLIEIEKVNINQLHTEEGTFAIIHAAKSGHLETVKYLVEQKADIRTQENKPNLLDYALYARDDDLEKIKYIATLYSYFEDDTTQLHAAAIVGKNDDLINSLVLSYPECIFDKNEGKATMLSYAIRMKNWETAYSLIEIYAKHAKNKDQLLNGLELFTYYFNYFYYNNELDKTTRREICLKLFALIETDKTIHSQLIQCSLMIFVNTVQSIPNLAEIEKLAHKAHHLIPEDSKEELLSKNLAWSLFNACIDLYKISANKAAGLLIESAMKSRSITKMDRIYLGAAKHYLKFCDPSFMSIRNISRRAAESLESKEFCLDAGLDYKNNYWFVDVIQPLMMRDTQEAYEAVVIFLKLALRIALEKTPENISYIAKLHFVMARNHLQLNQTDHANQIFNECQLTNPDDLDDSAIDELILAVSAFSKNNILDPLIRVYFFTRERFLDRLSALVLTENHWEAITLIIEALHKKGLIEVFLPNKIIAGIPLIIHAAKAGQSKLIKFFYANRSSFPDKGSELMTSVSGEAGNTKHCTALYFVGIAGDFTLFNDLLEEKLPLYHPAVDIIHTKPFTHALIENAHKNLSKLACFFKILSAVVSHYPEEINKLWQEETVIQFLDRMPSSVKTCLRPALRSKREIMQAQLEAQIKKHIIDNEILKSLLTGAERLSGKIMMKEQLEEAINCTDLLRDKIITLDSFINPYLGAGWMQVSESFYNSIFLPWYLACQTQASCYEGDSSLPWVEMLYTEQVMSTIKMVLKLVQDYFSKSRLTPAVAHIDPRETIIFQADASEEKKEEKKREPAAKLPVTKEMPKGEGSFPQLFKRTGKPSAKMLDISRAAGIHRAP